MEDGLIGKKLDLARVDLALGLGLATTLRLLMEEISVLGVLLLSSHVPRNVYGKSKTGKKTNGEKFHWLYYMDMSFLLLKTDVDICKIYL